MKQDHGLAARTRSMDFALEAVGNHLRTFMQRKRHALALGAMRRPGLRGDRGRRLVRDLGSKIIESGRNVTSHIEQYQSFCFYFIFVHFC